MESKEKVDIERKGNRLLFQLLLWFFASIAGILLIFAGISLVNSYSSSRELTASQPVREVVILPPATKTERSEQCLPT